MKQKVAFFAIGIAFCFTIAAWTLVHDLARAAPIEVSFLDIGEGDAIFININGLYQILIDGGPGKKISQELPQVLDFGDKTIDVMISTHPDQDHIEGLISVFKNYKIDYLVWSGLEKETLVFEEWKNATKKAREIKVVSAGDRILLDGVEFTILAADSEIETENTNLGSIVARLKKGAVSFLFTGDINSKKEMELVGKEVGSNVLKVAHHGSNGSSSQEFLNMVSPEITVISAGKDNFYGHPHEKVLARIKVIDAKIMRTDEIGTIQILSDGKYLIINNQ